MQKKQVKLGWVLRDMMQSTGVWTFESDAMHQMITLGCKAGFTSIEVGGGQSYQIALQQGYNPYAILRSARQAIENSKNPPALQVLLRGANQLGFKHYPTSLQSKNIDLLVDAGSGTKKQDALIIRNFDALNDAENLRFSLSYMVKKDLAAANQNAKLNKQGKPATAKRLHVQATLSYVRPKSDSADACYSTEYYVAYAKKLISIAELAGGQLDSLCIKDMSGQLAPDAAGDLIPALKKLNLPVYLHCHSTDEAKATATQLIAVECGIEGIEVALPPLAGGTSHNDVRMLCYHKHVADLNMHNLTELENQVMQIFADAGQRRDLSISLGLLKRMVTIGIPGGAIPFILSDLESQICGMLKINLEQALELFEKEISSIQEQLGHVPLVTPTADIVAKQAINNLANQVRAETYRVIDPRFCSLVLGYYGNVTNYATGEIIKPDKALVDDINQYCGLMAEHSQQQKTQADNLYPKPGALAADIHPTSLAKEEDYDLIKDYISELFKRYPKSCANYANQQECFVLHIMRPAGKTDRLLTQNILGPTEKRLRIILDDTLNLLPGKDIPESRDHHDDELTDQSLLTALGDYDGIVNTIRGLVLSGTQESIHSRLQEKIHEVIDPICKVNQNMADNRYYVERRFIALFASAVFWDIQRVCRRTGTDSRSGIDERTAFKLERIIAFTLRKRHREGRGQAKQFLS